MLRDSIFGIFGSFIDYVFIFLYFNIFISRVCIKKMNIFRSSEQLFRLDFLHRRDKLYLTALSFMGNALLTPTPHPQPSITSPQYQQMLRPRTPS